MFTFEVSPDDTTNVMPVHLSDFHWYKMVSTGPQPAWQTGQTYGIRHTADLFMQSLDCWNQGNPAVLHLSPQMLFNEFFASRLSSRILLRNLFRESSHTYDTT